MVFGLVAPGPDRIVEGLVGVLGLVQDAPFQKFRGCESGVDGEEMVMKSVFVQVVMDACLRIPLTICVFVVKGPFVITPACGALRAVAMLRILIR